MTIHFTPGDPNDPPSAVHHVQWKSHRVVAYGSGNNLILHTESSAPSADCSPSLQTIYLERDLVSVCVNGTNGLVAIASGGNVTIFRPVNEYMADPKWTEAYTFCVAAAHGETPVPLCVRWAEGEDELFVGSSAALSVFHVDIDYESVSLSTRWEKPQPSAIEGLDVTSDGSRIITYNYSNFDSFCKVWMRISYGEASLFDLIYADHEPLAFVTHFQWRQKPPPADSADLAAHGDALASMAHIKNIRSFMPAFTPDDNDVLYTVTSDAVLHVWATYDFNGHSYLKLWKDYDLALLAPQDYMGFFIVDHALWLAGALHDSLCKLVGETLYLPGTDVIVILGKKQSHLVAIANLSSNPPNCITFEKVCSFPTPRECLPTFPVKPESPEAPFTQDFRPADYLVQANPIVCSSPLPLGKVSAMLFLVHDRRKKTLRLVLLLVRDSLRFALDEKFQGHGKSVQKLFKSSSSHKGNIMLSVLNFPEHNYVWEPFSLECCDPYSVGITKKFRVDTTRHTGEDIHFQGIAHAVLLNDIRPAKNGLRHHLLAVIERGGYLSFWECDGENTDEEALLLSRSEIAVKDHQKPPKAFFYKKIGDSAVLIVAVFDSQHIFAWRVDTANLKNLDINPVTVDIAGAIEFHQLSPVDTFLEKDVSAITTDGIMRTISVDFDPEKNQLVSTLTSEVYTNIPNASVIHGASLACKVAIVDEFGLTLSIWDTITGLLEYEETFPEEFGAVRDLDWTFIGEEGPMANSILAVGFARFVLLYSQMRYDYTNRVATFAVVKKIDVSNYTSHVIGDLIWLNDSLLVLSSGNQFFIDDTCVQFGEKAGASNAVESTVKQLVGGFRDKQAVYTMSFLTRLLSGPLPLYHPQFLIQALLMDEVDIVETILVELLKRLRHNDYISCNLDLPLETLFARREEATRGSLFETDHLDIFETFTPSAALLLVEKLTAVSLPLLTRHQQITLGNIVLVLVKTAPLKSSLDDNGLKFMLAFELFEASPKQKELNIRDISWALHSDQKEMLFSTIENRYHRLAWDIVKKTGLAYWVDDHRLKTLMESVARNEFADERDPSGRVSIFYLAIKKKQILLGLWRTVSHPEKDKVIKFLSNDFTQPRWQSAALKNAFVLLGKHRYLDAAYFFLLAGKVRDCCMTLCLKVDDFDLALAVARVNSDLETLVRIIEQFILPKSITTGDRWKTSWAFWAMKLKEISIQALVESPIDVVKRNLDLFLLGFQKDLASLVIETRSRSFLRDDPVLATLYQTLRASKSRYLEGSRAVSPQTEFNFVVRISTIYSKMGCDYLSILLLRKWNFVTAALAVSNGRKEFKEKNGDHSAEVVAKIAPAPSAFEEPDMSAFSFGF